MSLTEEEKRRIYEEEKARLEAQEKARAEIEAAKQPKSFQLDAKGSKNQAIGLLFLILLVVGWSFFSRMSGGHGVNTSTVTGAVDTVTGGSLTMDKFNQIQTGMSYEQVCQIIGEPGQETSRTDMMGISTVMYMWQNPSGANMNAMFQNNKLNTKAQFGLN